MRAALNPVQLAQFSIVGRETDFDEQLGGSVPASGVVSIKANPKEKAAAAAAQLYKKNDKSKKQKAGKFKQKGALLKKQKV